MSNADETIKKLAESMKQQAADANDNPRRIFCNEVIDAMEHAQKNGLHMSDTMLALATILGVTIARTAVNRLGVELAIAVLTDEFIHNARKDQK